MSQQAIDPAARPTPPSAPSTPPRFPPAVQVIAVGPNVDGEQQQAQLAHGHVVSTAQPATSAEGSVSHVS